MRSITIFVPTHNRAKYLEQCIKSILNQTYKSFQVIILDNSSTDNTHSIVKSFSDKRIKYIKHDSNMGSVGNLNFAIEICTTDYFIIFHDDDIMLPNLVEKELSIMETIKGATIVSSLAEHIDESSNIVEECLRKSKYTKSIQVYLGAMYFIKNLKGVVSIACPTVLFKSSFMKENKLMFNECAGPACDALMWYEIERNGGKIVIIDEVLAKYRLHSSQDSQKNWSLMKIQLYQHLIKDRYYKKLLNENGLSYYKTMIHIYLKTCQQFLNGVITKEEYNQYRETIMYELTQSIFIRNAMRGISLIVQKCPNIYKRAYSLLRHVYFFIKRIL